MLDGVVMHTQANSVYLYLITMYSSVSVMLLTFWQHSQKHLLNGTSLTVLEKLPALQLSATKTVIVHNHDLLLIR